MVKSLYAAFATAMGLLLMASPAPQRKTRAIAAEGMSFVYVDLGSRPPVILVHGSISDYREWSTEIEALAKHHRVIAYSRRYHWPNPPPGKDANATVARQAEDLAAYQILATCAGEYCWSFLRRHNRAVPCAQHPELVRSLVLLEPPVPGALVGTPENEMVVKEGQAVNVLAFQLDFTSPRPALTCEDLQRIAAPTLVLTGGRSPMGLQQTAMGVARCLKGGNILKLPQATHHMQLDSPQEVNDAVLAFLAKH